MRRALRKRRVFDFAPSYLKGAVFAFGMRILLALDHSKRQQTVINRRDWIDHVHRRIDCNWQRAHNRNISHRHRRSLSRTVLSCSTILCPRSKAHQREICFNSPLDLCSCPPVPCCKYAPYDRQDSSNNRLFPLSKFAKEYAERKREASNEFSKCKANFVLKRKFRLEQTHGTRSTEPVTGQPAGFERFWHTLTHDTPQMPPDGGFAKQKSNEACCIFTTTIFHLSLYITWRFVRAAGMRRNDFNILNWLACKNALRGQSVATLNSQRTWRAFEREVNHANRWRNGWATASQRQSGELFYNPESFLHGFCIYLGMGDVASSGVLARLCVDRRSSSR